MTAFDEDLMQQKRHLPPEELTIEERDREIAAIFAQGILRLRKRRWPVALGSQQLQKSASQGLEFPHDSRLSVTTG